MTVLQLLLIHQISDILNLSKFIPVKYYYSYIPISNSMALVRKGTITTERPPLVGEVSANFCG
jgi:hypothetical protein